MALQKLRNVNIDLSDRRTQLIIGGALAVVIIVIVLLLVLRKPAGAGGNRPPFPMMGMMGMSGNMPSGGNTPEGGNTPSGGMTGMGMPGMGPMAMMGAGAPMGMGSMPGQAEAAKPTRKVPAGPPKEPSRADPFAIPIPKEVKERLARIDIVPPPRLTPQKMPMPATATIQVPFTRMAGVAVSQGVYALLEGANGRSFIVSPGDSVEGFTVERIESDKVILKSEDGEETTVELKGATIPSGMGGMPGMMPGAGMPGMMPGAGMPGMMPGAGMPGMMPGAGIPGMGGMTGMPTGRGTRFRGR
ncbi:MAG: hypothetical protein ACPLSK_03805 [bacterium]